MKNIILLILICNCTFSFGQNKLEKSKKELTNKSTSETKSETKKEEDCCDSKPNPLNYFSTDDLGGIFTIFVVAIGTVGYTTIGSYENEEHLDYTLSPYPFYNKKSGNYLNSENDTLDKNISRFDIHNSFVYENNNLYGNHFKAKYRPFQYFYLQADYHQLFEFNQFDNTKNQLSLFQFNFCYDRIRFEKFNLGWTVGANYIGNEVKKTGFAFGVNSEYFMGNHISFLGSAKWSRINGLPVNTYELHSKIHRKNFFFSIGLEHLKIATPTYNFVALGGGIYF